MGVRNPVPRERPGSRTRRATSGTAGVERRAERRELLAVKRRLDAREQRALLVADVIVEQLTERVQVVQACRHSGKVRCAAPQLHVLRQNADDVRVVWSDVASEHREQDLLLRAEMLARLVLEELREPLARSLGVGGCGPAQAKRHLQGGVVLPRQRGQLLGALHPLGTSSRSIGADVLDDGLRLTAIRTMKATTATTAISTNPSV